MGLGNELPRFYCKLDKDTGKLFFMKNDKKYFVDFIEGKLRSISFSDFKYQDDDGNEKEGKSLRLLLTDNKGYYSFQTMWYSNIGLTILNYMSDCLAAFENEPYALFEKVLKLSFSKTKPNAEGISFYRVFVFANDAPLSWAVKYTEIPDKEIFFDDTFKIIRERMDKYKKTLVQNSKIDDNTTISAQTDLYPDDDDDLPF